MGVIPVMDIDYGQIFGPFPSHLAMADPAYLIAMLTNDERQEGVCIKLDLSERKEGIKAVDWLPYIQPARTEEEQNMEAYMKEGHVYYRTLRIVRAGEELFVWYSKDFCHLLNIPDVQRQIGKNEGYICPQCGEVFEFAFPLRAHLKFRCTMRSSDMRSLIQDATVKRHLAISDYRGSERRRTENYKCESELLRDSMPNRSGDSPDSIPLELSPRRKDNLESELSRKRHLSSETSPPEKKVCTDSNKVGRETDINRLSPPRCETKTSLNDLDGHSDGASAFRKVEKSLSPVKERLSPSHPLESSSSVSLAHRLSAPMSTHSAIRGPVSLAMTSPSTSHPSVQQSQLLGLYMPRIPIMPQMSIPTNLAASSEMYVERAPVRFPGMVRSQIQGPLTESFANVRNGDSNSDMFAKQQMMLAERARMSYPSFLKSHNPMVEKMIHKGTNPTQIDSPMNAMDLSQNWCAKCNASFRMTSDLVYHMRSHHKREFDPLKKKRDDKLQCHICSETFRERHHLTRHMTSHL